jgi:integrase
MRRKPTGKRREAQFYEMPSAALILEGAQLFIGEREGRGVPFLYPLVAALLLTGGRRSEVLGLEVADVSFDRETVWFRPNETRRIKTAKSNRVVPLWPQLREILEQYLADRPPSRLLFPCWVSGKEQMLTDERKAFDALAEYIGWEPTSNVEPDKIRAQAVRNTYMAARLQTLDNGHPISIYTVQREGGWSPLDMLQRIYGHVGQIRHRADMVEYRVDHYKKQLGERLQALRATHQKAHTRAAEIALRKQKSTSNFQ